MKQSIRFLIATLVLGVAVNALGISKTASRPNILFFAFDDLRPLISAYGEPEPITPNLDAQSEEGVRFDRNYVAYPLCNPSRATMLTGIRFLTSKRILMKGRTYDEDKQKVIFAGHDKNADGHISREELESR